MMEAALLVQYVIVALAVVCSAGFVAKRQFPQGTRRLRLACAVPLVREGRPSWVRRIGHWVAPMPLAQADGCGGCNGCEPG